MKTGFARTSNVNKFLAGVTTVEERGAKEASMLLVTGDPGFGKTATVIWWATQHAAVYLRAKATSTPHGLLSELVEKLGMAPKGSALDLEKQIVVSLIRDPHPLVIDEVEHTLHDIQVLESLRDITDLVEIPLVLVGMEQVQAKIARHAQISSRIASVVLFRPATVADVRICCETLCEVPIADDLVEEIHRQSGGRTREVLNAIALVERFGKGPMGGNGKRAVNIADMAGHALTHDWQARRPRVVKVAGSTGGSR